MAKKARIWQKRPGFGKKKARIRQKRPGSSKKGPDSAKKARIQQKRSGFGKKRPGFGKKRPGFGKKGPDPAKRSGSGKKKARISHFHPQVLLTERWSRKTTIRSLFFRMKGFTTSMYGSAMVANGREICYIKCYLK